MHTDKQTYATLWMRMKNKISILYFAASTGAGCAPAPPPSPPRTWGGSAGGGSTATPTPPPTQRYTHHSSPSSSWWHHCFETLYYKYFYLTLHTFLSSRWTLTVPRPAQTTRTEASALTTDKLSVEGRMGFRRQKSESYNFIYFCVDKCIMILIIYNL